MKKILRSKSDTNIFYDKEYLDLIHENMNKFKTPKLSKLDMKRNKKKSMYSNLTIKNQTAIEDSENLIMDSTQTTNFVNSRFVNKSGGNSRINSNSNINFNLQTTQVPSKFQNSANILSSIISEESIEEGFKQQLRKILNFKLEFDKQYLERVIFERKAYVNMIFEIILLNLKKFKENYLRGLNNESVYESPMSMSRFENHSSIPQITINYTENSLKENFEKFEEILEILIQTSPEEFFREVKSLILNEFDKTVIKIQSYLEKRKNGIYSKLFTWISQSILFILSQITFKLDVYYLTVNCLVEKMNKTFVDFIEKYANLCANETRNSQINHKFFSKSLNIIQRFIKLKKYFIKDFCHNNSADFRYNESYCNDNNENKAKFSFNKFNSFGRYLFNNCVTLMNLNAQNNNLFSSTPLSILKSKTIIEKENVIFYIDKMRKKQMLMKMHSRQYLLKKENLPAATVVAYGSNGPGLSRSNSNSAFTTGNNNSIHNLNSITALKNSLDVNFKLYFSFKLANWKYTSIQCEKFSKKTEICRICESTFAIDDFILHISFCKDQRLYYQKIIDLNRELAYSLDDLKSYKEKLIYDDGTKLKDILFSPKSEFSQKFRLHLMDRSPNPKRRASIINKKENNSDNELLVTIITALGKEKETTYDDYEKQPYKLSHLISLVHFSVLILNKNKNCFSFSKELNEIFARLFNKLMKKMFVVENILSLQDNRESAKLRIKNFYSKKQANVVNIMNTPSLKYRELDDKDSSNNSYSRNISGFNTSTNKIESPKKGGASNKTFLMILDDTQTKFKKINNVLKSPGPAIFVKQLNNLKVNFPKVSSDNSMTNLLFPKIAKKEKSSTNLLNMNLEKINSLNTLNKYSKPNNATSKNIPNIFRNNNPQEKKIKEIGKELKLFASNSSNTVKNNEKLSSVKSNFSNFNLNKNNTENNIKSSNTNPFKIEPIITIIHQEESVNPSEDNRSSLANSNMNIIVPGSPFILNRMSTENENETITINETNDEMQFSVVNSPGFFNKQHISKDSKTIIPKTSDKLKSLFKSNDKKEKHVNFDSPQTLVFDSENLIDNSSNKFNNDSSFDSTEIIENELKENFQRNTRKCLTHKSNFNVKYDFEKIDNNDENYDNFEKHITRRQSNNDILDDLGMEMDIQDNNENDEIDSQFDEIIDLMDEIQIFDQKDENVKDREGNMTVIRDEHEFSSSSSIASKDKYAVTNQMKILDFKFLKPIAKGGYGRVDIYKKIKTGDIYAIKTVNIKKMKAKNVSGLLKKETIIFNEIFSDYVVKCFWMFSDNINYYYVMEYMPGGNLLNFLNSYVLRNETIQLIVAEMLLSLEYLHSKNIIHRDIKPENIVISYDSHFRLTDFGISEVGLQQNKYAISNFHSDLEDIIVKSDKILGTEHYLAPEIFKDEPITYQLDYWSLGVLIYELYTNKVPFMAENFSKISENILNLKINWEPFEKLKETKQYSEIHLNLAKDLIIKFLVIDPQERWGYNNIEECKNHNYFKNFDWKNIINISDPLVKKHVLEQIREVNKKPNTVIDESLDISKREDNNDKEKVTNISLCDPDLTIEYEKENFLNSERIDNLYLMCQDVLKKNIKQKTLNIDTGDEKFTDMMNDLLG